MEAAIRCARQNESPYGAVLYNYSSGEMVIVANSVGGSGDPTAHAEVNAIRQAAQQNMDFRQSILISTCEPCPMCAMAAVWSGIRTIYFGASIDDAARYGHQVKVYCREIAAKAWYDLKVVGGVLRPQCLELFKGRS